MNWRVATPMVIGLLIVIGVLGWQRSALIAEPAPEAPPPPVVARGQSPTLARFGFTLGETTIEEVDAWIAQNQLSCDVGGPNKKGLVFRECKALPTNLFPGQTLLDDSELTLSFPESGKLQRLQLVNSFDDPEAALEEYQTALAPLEAVLGPPSERSDAGDSAAMLQKRMTRVAAEWAFEDVEVRLIAMRPTFSVIRVTELWVLSKGEPGKAAEAKAAD